MNFAAIMALFNYGLVLIYGVLLSIDISGGWSSKKDKQLTAAIIAFLLMVQIVVCLTSGTTAAENLYPLITHIPLVCALFLFMKRPIWISIVSVFTAYLCCQIPNWFGILVLHLADSALLSEICYTIAVFISYILLHKFLVKPAYEAMNYSERTLFFLGSLPVFYYIFDYATTVYTSLLYDGNRLVSEFFPFVMSICYLVFCIVYCRQFERQQQISTQNYFMQIKQAQFQKEIESMQRNEKNVSLLRHDMRHFLNNIAAFIENGEDDKALDYIRSVVKTSEKTVNKRYCSNDIINIILLSNADSFAANNIDFKYSISAPAKLDISDIDMTSILQNALENAQHAVMALEPDKRFISLSISKKNDKLLISVENPYAFRPKMINGMPVATETGHGLGTKSIQKTVEQLHGNCQFSVTDNLFLLRIIL